MEESEIMSDKKLSLEAIQAKEYDILCVFADVCDKYQLRYALCGGTLLGAIRHKGFIPWDDDIDVVMPRTDYNKLLTIAEQAFPQLYKLSSPRNDPDTFHAYSKIYDLNTELIEYPESKKIRSHLYIDVFPIDGMPDGLVKQKRHMVKTRRRMLTFYALKIAKYKLNEKLTFYKRIFWHILNLIDNLIPKQWLIKWVDSIATKYNVDDSKFQAVIVAGYGEREIMPKWVYQYEGKVFFEKKEFRTFSKTDYYLTNLYGDYMKLPPKEKRIPHRMEVYDK